MNVKLPDSVFVDLYDATGIAVGNKIDALNITPNDISLYSSAAEPTVSDDHIPLLFGRGKGQNEAGDAGAWAICIGGGAIDIQEVV